MIGSGRAAAKAATSFGVSWWLVQRALDSAALTLPDVDALTPRMFGIDEHRYRSVRFFRVPATKAWKRYEPWMTTIVDLGTGQARPRGRPTRHRRRRLASSCTNSELIFSGSQIQDSLTVVLRDPAPWHSPTTATSADIQCVGLEPPDPGPCASRPDVPDSVQAPISLQATQTFHQRPACPTASMPTFSAASVPASLLLIRARASCRLCPAHP